MRGWGVVGLAVLVLSGASLGACETITGIDSYSKANCNGGDCDAGDDASLPMNGHDATADGKSSSSSGGGSSSGGHDASSSGSGSGSGSSSGGSSGSSSGGGPDSGCGPLDTISNCSACGAACDTIHSNGATCNGTTCQYASCANGYSDCDKQAPDTNGCECATPACCGATCQTAHDDGVGQTFYDCNPKGTLTIASATEACVAYALTVGGAAKDCFGGWWCPDPSMPIEVCYSATANFNDCTTYCWIYTGSLAGHVQTCTGGCNATVASWN